MKRIVKTATMIGFVGGTSMLMFGINGKAYIDPSVTTYIIQAIAGLVIAIGAVVAVYFRRAKKKLNDKLGIDDNRNKEVESDDILGNKKAGD